MFTELLHGFSVQPQRPSAVTHVITELPVSDVIGLCQSKIILSRVLINALFICIRFDYIPAIGL